MKTIPIHKYIKLLESSCIRYNYYHRDELLQFMGIPNFAFRLDTSGIMTEVDQQRNIWRRIQVLQKLRKERIIKWSQTHRKWKYLG